MSTPRKPAVLRRKLEAYYKAGTCEKCGRSIVANDLGQCRRCRPPTIREREERQAQEVENFKATKFFHYWLTVRKKDAGDIGTLARAILGDTDLKRLMGLDALASGTTADVLDVKVLERAWDESEWERGQEAAG